MKKKIFVRGPVLSQSGYGEQSRFALRALKSREDLFDIYIQPIPWGQTGWVWEESDFRSWMDEKISATQILMQKKQLQPDLSLQITIPNEFEKMCPINIGYTAGIETTKVAAQWLQKGNEQVDKILVVSNHAKSTYENTVAQAQNTKTGETIPYKLDTPIDVVWETTPRREPEPIDQVSLDYDNNFLMVSQMGPRKNFVNAIKWWVEEFIDQEVGLIVKTNIKSNSTIDWEHLQAHMKNLLEPYADRKCKVYVLHGDLTAGQMTWLYNHDKIKALVNIAHGEGFGLPLFEAAREALPIITIGWSGQMDFLHHNGKDYFESVEYTLQPVQEQAVWEGVVRKDSLWAFASQGSYKMTLRKALKKWPEIKQRAIELKSLINDKFNDEKLFSNFINCIIDKNELEWIEDMNKVETHD